MPIGYLVSVAVVTLGTLAAPAPVRRPPLLARLSFRLGLLFNELPFLAATWLLLWALFALGQDDITGPAGRAVLGLATLTLTGLAVVVGRGLLARPSGERALRAGLPGQPTASEPRGLPWGHILLAPLLLRRGDALNEAHGHPSPARARGRASRVRRSLRRARAPGRCARRPCARRCRAC